MNKKIGLKDMERQDRAVDRNTILLDEHLLWLEISDYHGYYRVSNLMAMHSFYKSMYKDLRNH